jgi:hypothetical protein
MLEVAAVQEVRDADGVAHADRIEPARIVEEPRRPQLVVAHDELADPVHDQRPLDAGGRQRRSRPPHQAAQVRRDQGGLVARQAVQAVRAGPADARPDVAPVGADPRALDQQLFVQPLVVAEDPDRGRVDRPRLLGRDRELDHGVLEARRALDADEALQAAEAHVRAGILGREELDLVRSERLGAQLADGRPSTRVVVLGGDRPQAELRVDAVGPGVRVQASLRV